MKAVKCIGIAIVGILGATALFGLTGLVVMLLWNALLPVLFGLPAVTFWQAVGLAVMALWNWLMPTIFGLPEVTYWQAVGLFILCHLLFKGHHGPRGRGQGPPRWDRRREHFARKVKERVDSFDPAGACRARDGEDGVP